MAELHNIYWMATPLAYKQRDAWKEKLASTPALGEFVSPAGKTNVFWKIKHWTLEVDGQCFELSPDAKKKLNVKKVFASASFSGIPTTDLAAPHRVSKTDWKADRDPLGIEPERRFVGQTTWTVDQIEKEGLGIWNDHNHGWYGFFTQNCQNYALMLYKAIATESPAVEQGPYQRIPVPASYRLAQVSKASIPGATSWTMLSGRTAFVAYVAEATPAVGATGVATVGDAALTATGGVAATGVATTGVSTTGVATAGVATTGTAGTGASTGVIAASTGTGSMSSAAGSTVVVAEGTGTAGAAGGGAAGATTGATTQTAAGGAKGVAVGGGKVGGIKAGGFAAKLKAGVSGAKAAKLGAVGLKAAPLCLHPLGAGMVLFVLAYFALRGERGKLPGEKELLKRMRGQNSNVISDVLSIFTRIGMLRQEEKWIEEAEGNRGKSVEELVEEAREKVNKPPTVEKVEDDGADESGLADELALKLVTTEPGEMTEEESIIPDKDMMDTDARRAYTLA